MKLKIGRNEIEYLQEYPIRKGPKAKEIAKKLEAIGFTCVEYSGVEHNYHCCIVPYFGGNQVLVDVTDHQCRYATKFNFQVIKDTYSNVVPRGVFEGWKVITYSYINNLDFNEEFFIEYRDWFIRKMKEKDLAIVSLNADLEDEHALEEMARNARRKRIENGTFMTDYKQC